MTRARYLWPLVCLLLVACGDKKSTDDTGTPDVSVGDGGTGDKGPWDTLPGEGLPPDITPDAKPSINKWVTIQDPAPLVEDHTVTLLKNGEVLIAGGNKYDGDDHFQDLAYRFVPSTDKFTDAGKMTSQHGLHTATLLKDGRVLVTGGQSDTDYLKTTELYDPQKPATQAWTKGPDMFKSRWSHTATLLQNSEVLIAGGFYSSDVTASLVVYDPVQNNWKVPSAIMAEGRMSHTATLLANGKVIFAGGVQGSSFASMTWLDSIEIYDPGSGAMVASNVKMSKKRAGHTATLLQNGKVLIVGGYCGNNCGNGQLVDDIYDPATDTISPLAHAGDLPSSHVAVKLLDGRVLVAGDNDKVNYANVVAYDPKGGGFWSQLPPLPVGRWGGEATILDDGSVFVVGGATESNPYTLTPSAQRYYP